MRNDNTIYLRPSKTNAWYRWEVFVKTRGEGVICGGVEREDAIKAGATSLWAINKWGPEEWKNHGPIDTHPECPKIFDYPVVDEFTTI